MSNEFTAVFSSDDRTSGSTHDFTIRLNPPMNLQTRYKMSLQDLSLWYTWYNISDDYANTEFKYYNGVDWKTVAIEPGIYNASALIAAITALITAEGDDPLNLVISTNVNTQKFIITLAGGYQVDFTNMPIRTIFGADSTVYNISFVAPTVAKMTNGVNTWLLHSDLIDYGIAGSFPGKVLHSFNPQSSPGSNIREIPQTVYTMVKSGNHVQSVRFWFTDQTGRALNLNGEPVSIRLHFHPA